MGFIVDLCQLSGTQLQELWLIMRMYDIYIYLYNYIYISIYLYLYLYLYLYISIYGK